MSVSTSDGSKAFYQFSLQHLLLAVRVECTVQYLRADTDDWPKFYDSLEKYWGNYADDTQEPEHNDDNDDTGLRDTFLELKEELWAVQKQPELRHELLKRRKRDYMMRMMQSFLSDAWTDAGHSFLEGVAQNLRTGLYVPDGFKPSMRQGTSKPEKSLPDKAMHMKNSDPQLAVASRDKIVGTSTPKSRDSSMPSGSIPEKPNDISMANDSSSRIHMRNGACLGRDAETFMATDLLTRPSVLQGSSPPPNAINSTVPKDSERPSTCKDSEEGPHFPGRPSLESHVDASIIKGPRSLLGCTELIRPEEKHTQLESLPSSRRKIPTSLKEGKRTDSNTDVAEVGTKVHMRVTRSSSVAGTRERDTTVVNRSSGFCQKPRDSVVSAKPGLKSSCIAGTGKPLQTEALEERRQGSHDLQTEQLMCPSPPPWTGSLGMYDLITTRKRPRLAPFGLDGTNTSKPVAAVGEVGNIETPVIVKAQSELREGQASLNAVVQDPLPEALNIAEDVAKGVQQVHEQTISMDNKIQSLYTGLKINNNLVQLLEGDVSGPQEKHSRKGIMDRNPTAHTVEWESSDDISDSLDDQSPSHSRRIHLPKIRTRQSFASRGGIIAHNKPKRRKLQKWSEEETNVLRKEVERYGKGHWKHILQKHKHIFEGRTEVDLKDKWRNIERREGIL